MRENQGTLKAEWEGKERSFFWWYFCIRFSVWRVVVYLWVTWRWKTTWEEGNYRAKARRGKIARGGGGDGKKKPRRKRCGPGLSQIKQLPPLPLLLPTTIHTHHTCIKWEGNNTTTFNILSCLLQEKEREEWRWWWWWCGRVSKLSVFGRQNVQEKKYLNIQEKEFRRRNLQKKESVTSWKEEEEREDTKDKEEKSFSSSTLPYKWRILSQSHDATYKSLSKPACL